MRTLATAWADSGVLPSPAWARATSVAVPVPTRTTWSTAGVRTTRETASREISVSSAQVTW